MFTALIETASQKVLATDSQTLARLKRLEGKVVALEIKKLDLTFYLQVHSNFISFEPDSFGKQHAEKIDVTLKAKPSTLLKIARDGMEEAKLESGELEIEGDAITGQRFASLINQLDIDWEELISQKIGDAPARLLFDIFDKARSWSVDTQKTMKMNLGEYLVEEAQVAAHSDSVAEFIHSVDTLRNDVARLEARTQALSQKLNK